MKLETQTPPKRPTRLRFGVNQIRRSLLLGVHGIQEPMRCGYGPCSISGCPCRNYKESYGSELCSNCGHKYTDHG